MKERIQQKDLEELRTKPNQTKRNNRKLDNKDKAFTSPPTPTRTI